MSEAIRDESRSSKSLGVGVLGLHEGRTLLMALHHPVPATVGKSRGQEFRSTHARAVAGCDQNSEKLNAARAEAPELVYVDDYQALLAMNEVDIVAIYTPDALHGEHITQAFEAGKNVICTKPLVNCIADARRVLEAGRRTGRRLLVGQSTRFFEPFRRQRADFDEGKFGDIEFIDAHYNHRMDWYYDKSPWATQSTDWIFLGMSHPIDLVRWYLGPIATVSAVGAKSSLARRYDVKSRDIVTVNFTSRDGRVGRALGHYGLHELPIARNAIELMLYGSEGTSLAQYHDMRYVHTDDSGAEVTEDFLYEKRGYYFNNEVHGMHYGEFANYADAFASAILEDRPQSPGLFEGLETFAIMEAVRRSVESGGPVQVGPIAAEIGLTEEELAG